LTEWEKLIKGCLKLVCIYVFEESCKNTLFCYYLAESNVVAAWSFGGYRGEAQEDEFFLCV
jgi:hypothetical protein